MAEIRHIHCKAHCRACGGHFSSTGAFDMHRSGKWAERHCLGPMDDKRFAVKGRPGVCEVADPSTPVVGVTVWTKAQSIRSWQERKAVVA